MDKTTTTMTPEELKENYILLEQQNTQLEQQNALLSQQNVELTAKVNWLMEQFQLSQHRRFGSSSEQTSTTLEQLSLFNEAEMEAKPELPEPTMETITYKRKKQKGQREEMLKDLPVEIIEYRLPEDQQNCPQCDGPMHEMGFDERQELKFIPAQVKVIKHRHCKYGCRNCEHNEISTPIITAPAPAPVIPGSLASPSAIAYVMNQKYVDGLPLYRQEKQLERLGIELSRQTMANWMIKGSDWLTKIYDRLHEHLLKLDILNCDETTLQVLHEDGREANTKSYMWLYRSGRYGPPIVLFDYQTTRAGKHPINFLSGYKGYIHIDGYAGYNGLIDVILVGCLAHARRGFTDALKAMPEGKTAPVTAQEGLDFCNRLFAIERTLIDADPDVRYQERLKQSRPVLDTFNAWLCYQSPRVLPKSALGKAITYCRNQWDKLEAFMLDGRLEISNNLAERSIKPFIIGRKNFLFSNTPRGARASAVIYSIVETAKENGLIPFEYLTYLFERLPNLGSDDLDELLPWSDKLPDICRLHK
jgi:transposase